MSEETHYACDEELKKHGAQTLCCACNEHNCIETSVRLDLQAPKNPTPTQSDWEEKLQQVRLQFVTADDEADRIEVWEKQVLPLLATSQQETLERVVKGADEIKSWHPDSDEPCVDYKKLIALIKETITPPK